MEYLLLESHFWVSSNSIRPNTRNVCSNELVSIIYKVSEIIYPEEKIEVFVLPSEVWSYKDILKITWAHLVWISTVVSAVFGVLLYRNDSEKHKIEMVNTCIETIKNINSLSWDDITISNEDFQKICENHGVVNSKNRRYEILEKDETIEYEETIIVNWWEKNTVVSSNKIERSDFHSMITVLPENENFEWNNYKWIIELITLVVKQKKEWKWIPWKWIYYWDEIMYHWVKILSSEDEINFYMQDETFKQKIRDKEIEFKNWDNITVIFEIKTEISNWTTKNMNIYVKEVTNFNETVIIHEVKKDNKPQKINNQQPLFEVENF